MNSRSPRPLLDAVLFVLLIMALFWRTYQPEPVTDSYVEESYSHLDESSSRVDAVNRTLEEYLMNVQSRLAGQSNSRLLSALLIALITLFIAVRARLTFLHAKQLTEQRCPVCGGPIVRVRRSTWHRIMEKALLLPVRNFHCVNPDCGWTGPRFGRYE